MYLQDFQLCCGAVAGWYQRSCLSPVGCAAVGEGEEGAKKHIA